MYYHDYTYYAVQSLDVFDALAWIILALAAYSVVGLWRGMRQDSFERSIRTLQQQPDAVGVFSSRPLQAAAQPKSAWLQISLLPLMLLSCGMAMLLAQAQRPDEVSRPATWAVFVIAGTWYGSRMWSHRRGIGPLRNHALAGVVTAMAVSFALWTFYFAVDYCWADNGFHRVTSSLGVLLWWTALGGLAGGIVGAFQANRWYARFQVQSHPASTATEPMPVSARPRDRRMRWSPIILACLASLLVHVSAAPHIHRAVKARYWWHWNARHSWRHDSSNLGVSLTMTPVNSTSAQRRWWIDTAPINISHLVDPTKADSLRNESFDIPTFPYPGGTGMQGAMTASATNDAQYSYSSIVLNRDVAVGEQITARDLSERVVTDSSQDSMVGMVRNIEDVVGAVARTPLKAGAFINSSQVVFINDGSSTIQVVDLNRRVPTPAELRGVMALASPANVTEEESALKGTAEGPAKGPVNSPVKGPLKDALPETGFDIIYDGPGLLPPNVPGQGAIYTVEGIGEDEPVNGTQTNAYLTTSTDRLDRLIELDVPSPRLGMGLNAARDNLQGGSSNAELINGRAPQDAVASPVPGEPTFPQQKSETAKKPDFQNLVGQDVAVTLKDGRVVTGRLTALQVNEQLVLSTPGGKTTIKWAAVDRLIKFTEPMNRGAPLNTWSQVRLQTTTEVGNRTTVTRQPQPQRNTAPAATPAEPSDIPLPVGDFAVPVNDLLQGETTEVALP